MTFVSRPCPADTAVDDSPSVPAAELGSPGGRRRFTITRMDQWRFLGKMWTAEVKHLPFWRSHRLSLAGCWLIVYASSQASNCFTVSWIFLPDSPTPGPGPCQLKHQLGQLRDPESES
ncbi:hypothetical protein VULLAG_LOCUS9781 [Vulpes lagopus]